MRVDVRTHRHSFWRKKEVFALSSLAGVSTLRIIVSAKNVPIDLSIRDCGDAVVNKVCEEFGLRSRKRRKRLCDIESMELRGCET